MKDNALRLKLSHSLNKRAKKSNQNIWKVASKKIVGARQNRSLVNVGEIARCTKEGSKVLVAGKVLGGGTLSHKVTVAAHSFSESAKLKINQVGGECLSLEEFIDQNASVKGVLILG